MKLLKKIIPLTLCAALLTGCTSSNAGSSGTSETIAESPGISTVPQTEVLQASEETFQTSAETVETALPAVWEDVEVQYGSLDDELLLAHIEDTVYAEAVRGIDSEEYFVENVSASYVSKEYIEELEFNSQPNIYFGYTLADLNDIFRGTKYVFTLGEDGQTTVRELEEIEDNSGAEMLKDVVVGAGVILVCVTVSAVSGGLGGEALSMIFAVSAKSGAIAAVSTAAMGGVSAGILRGIETGDMSEALEAALPAAGEGFKWGAIGGVISGGVSEAIGLKGATLNKLTMNEAAMIQKETKWPLDIIKSLHSKEEADILKAAGLKPVKVNETDVLIRTIDWDMADELGRTNRQRVSEFKLAPIGSDGKPLEMHHIGQKADGPLAILTYSEHHSKDNYAKLHYAKEGKDIANSAWDKQRRELWKQILELTGG